MRGDQHELPAGDGDGSVCAAQLAIAVGLAMDAFAVSIGIGLNAQQVSSRTTVRLAWHFGLFQVLMPILGLARRAAVARWISGVDHWIAFGLLAAIGGNMIYEALWGDEEERAGQGRRRAAPRSSCSPWRRASTRSPSACRSRSSASQIWYPAVVIGVVAFAFTAVGLHLGRRFGALLGKRMEIVGGLILIGIGVKILVEHRSSSVGGAEAAVTSGDGVVEPADALDDDVTV